MRSSNKFNNEISDAEKYKEDNKVTQKIR